MRGKCFAFTPVLSSVAFLLFLGTASAQDYRAKVQGIVTDPSQAAITAAKVTLKNVNTGIEAGKLTDSTGRYLFDFVVPGTYTVTVEAAGFQRFLQENVSVLTRGDVTVNAMMTVGGVAETVTVTEEVSTVQFNTSTMTTTVQGSMLKDIPVLARNPYTLALLNPAVVNQYWDVAHRNPFYMWSSGGLDVGGSTGGKNDQELDGVSLNISARGSYNASMDSVQEVSVQQNAVDAEFGFSAGGTLNLSMKSGTNDFHGTGYYFGRNPKLNAMTNRITREESVVRNNIWGGTIGGPIRKNKLFTFFSYEQWKSTQPSSNVSTVPTDLERTGDFSRSLTPQGNLRTIYDPFSTVFDSTNTANPYTRMPFAGNRIPTAMLNPSGVKAVSDLWKPNRAGDDPSGVNNFKNAYAWWVKYWNISDRTDYNINDKWRMYARYSKYQTRLDNPNWGNTIAVPSDNGGLMDALNAAADVLYMASPHTTINIRYGATYLEDDYDSGWAKVPESTWAGLFPSGWYKPVLAAVPGIYYPRFNYNGNGSAYTGFGGWWLVRGRSHNPSAHITHDRGIHHMKAGWQLRYSYDRNGLPTTGDFSFNSIDTGRSPNGYDATQTGSMYASALLGVLNSGSSGISPMFNTHQQQWGFYFHDDIKLTRNITVNLGLRYEYETAPLDENRVLTRELDLTNPIPDFQGANTPVMPAQVTSIAKIAYQYNGAFIFTSDSQKRMYDAQKLNFLPRAGVAIRINDTTSFRAGFARYAVPMVAIHPEGFPLPKYGYNQSTDILGPQEGKPRALVSDPFPSSNQLRLPPGNSLGRYTQLGDSMSWYAPNTVTPKNDRINFSLQREMPYRIVTDATFFMNFGHDVQDPSMWGGDYGRSVNMTDPNLIYQYKAATDQAVANPFYGLPANKMPGNLRLQPTVSVAQLLRQYPQYQDLTISASPGQTDHYYSFQFKAERAMSNGITFLVGYNYARETHSYFFNDLDKYNYQFQTFDRGNPRHYLRVAGTWELPFGKGRKYLSSAGRLVDGIVGGWATSHILMWNNGPLMRFDQAVVTGDPTQNVPAGLYFNPAVFQVAPAYTPRTNPFYYPGIRGPNNWQLDSTLVKYFHVTPERVRFELRMEFYNMPNHFIPSDPNLSIGSGTMGQSTWVHGGNYGREVQFTGRIHF